MELTIEDKAILAHVVSDPDAWVAHALEHGGGVAVMAKIERWRDDYLSKKDLPGYMTRAERDVYKTPEQIAAEAAREVARQVELVKQAAKVQAFLDNLPSWAIVDQAVTDIFDLPSAKAFIRKLARVVYWDIRNQED